MHVQTQVLDRNVRESHGLVAQMPIPVEHKVGHQLRQTDCGQLDAEAQVGLHAKVNAQHALGVGHHLVERQAPGRVAFEVDVEVPDQSAALETQLAEIAVFVGDRRCEEKQLATAGERRDDRCVLWVAIQVGADVQTQLGLGRVQVGAQEEALAR